MVWKTVFFTVWEATEKREDGKLRRKFSSWAHQFFSSQIGRKTLERKRSHCAIIGLPSPNVYKFINSTPISNPKNQQHTHIQQTHIKIHQTHIKIHQTHIQIHINNQSEIEKRRRRRRRCQNHHFLHPKFLLSPPKITALNQTHPKIIIYNKSIKLKL